MGRNLTNNWYSKELKGKKYDSPLEQKIQKFQFIMLYEVCISEIDKYVDISKAMTNIYI